MIDIRRSPQQSDQYQVKKDVQESYCTHANNPIRPANLIPQEEIDATTARCKKASILEASVGYLR